MNYHLKSLQQKLSVLASGEDIGLTPAEAAIYGAEYADEWSDGESLEVDEDE
ncbi:hypothetical protein [Sphingobacterium chungjuense]|uniref:hypothetical protein n=1 Tax=Sphingobacterium chungjuense TaxID=2675553 RepID=UPI001407FC52|nr:hypothetical protein [Sphingobacterium chungjuense]